MNIHTWYIETTIHIIRDLDGRPGRWVVFQATNHASFLKVCHRRHHHREESPASMKFSCSQCFRHTKFAHSKVFVSVAKKVVVFVAWEASLVFHTILVAIYDYYSILI